MTRGRGEAVPFDVMLAANGRGAIQLDICYNPGGYKPMLQDRRKEDRAG